MNIALIGYGNMGQEIEGLIAEGPITGLSTPWGRKGHRVVSISYKNRADGLDTAGIKGADVAIDFTAPDVVLKTIPAVITHGVPLVIGTTGWYDKLPEVKKMVTDAAAGLVYGQNFSVGANIFFALTAYAGQLIHQFDGYDVFGIETHHTGKKDSPSGTARKLGEILLQNYPRKKILQIETLQRKIESDELHFASVRGGRNFGRHEIVFDSEADEIRLTHQAWGRRGFAEGSLLAAAFITDKKGVYDFSDVFRQQFMNKS
jgi:4-hydroxy-tetrahydrodipicolinate reductase